MPPLVRACSMNTINLFKKGKEYQKGKKKETKELEVGPTVVNELLSSQPIE